MQKHIGTFISCKRNSSIVYIHVSHWEEVEFLVTLREGGGVTFKCHNDVTCGKKNVNNP